MLRYSDEESHFPSQELPTNKLESGEKPTDMPKEFSSVPTVDVTTEEYSRRKTKKEEPKKSGMHELLKRIMLAPVAGVMIAAVTILSSFGLDPLGDDVFGGHGHSESEQPHIEEYYFNFKYLPTGQSVVFPESKDYDAMEQGIEWVASLGGDTSNIKFITSTEVFQKVAYVEDYYYEYNEDDPENPIIKGEWVYVYRVDLYYEADAATIPEEKPDDAFPNLSNLPPNGYVYFNSYGVLDEEFIRVESPAVVDWIYAVEKYIEQGVDPVYVEGIEYDPDTNTLTLENYTGPVLNINMMGNGFKIKLKGYNSIDRLLIWGFHYAGSVLITGNGTLTVNASRKYDVGIYLKAEMSPTCLMIDRGVNVTALGEVMAIGVEDTSMEDKAVFYLAPTTLEGGYRQSGSYLGEENGYDPTYGNFGDYTVIDPSTGKPATRVSFISGLEPEPEPEPEPQSSEPPVTSSEPEPESSTPASSTPASSTPASSAPASSTPASSEPQTSSEPEASSEPPAEETDTADTAFPTLSERAYWPVSDAYVYLKTPAVTNRIYVGDSATAGPDTVEGISYNGRGNSIVLENYSAPTGTIECYAMGSSFNIEVVGNCNVGGILVHGAGGSGSVKITGSGTLSVNSRRLNDYGIELDGGLTESCLLIDSGVTLSVYGDRSAIHVHDTDMEKSIYFLSPLNLTGGVRNTTEHNGYYDSTIVDANGDPSPYVYFSK